MSVDIERFDALADALGVSRAFTHAAGHEVVVPRATRAKLLTALGHAGEDLDALGDAVRDRALADWRRGLPPVLVVPAAGAPSVPIVLPSAAWGKALVVHLHTEDGADHSWPLDAASLPVAEAGRIDGTRMERRDLRLSEGMPHGYHQLIFEIGRPVERRLEMSLIITPGRCWLPDALADDRKLWGLSVQLYGLRSRGSQGIGDFSDLCRLSRDAQSLGAAFVGLNPTHALFLERPDRRSPYSPNSRRFLNPLYIDVGAGAQPFDNAGGLVEYAAVTRHKVAMLEASYRSGSLPEVEPGLRAFAVFETLRENRAFTGPEGTWQPWWRWPEEFRRSESTAVEAFAARHEERIGFHAFLQHTAEAQLAEAAREARRLPIGLYRDIAVGVDRDGADCWMFQDAMPKGISVGCPPDLRNPMGQDWGVVPFSPDALRAQAYRPFIETIRANMRGAGMVRLDHAFQLLRLFWIPLGSGPAEGGYVRYPMEDLLGIIALESHRNRCAVVAEDLGTIPKGFRERIMDWNTLSSRILHRERGAHRSYRPPAAYSAMATVATGTHDQATLAGFWRGRDVELRTALGLYPSANDARKASVARKVDRQRLVEAMIRHVGFEGEPETAGGEPSEDLVVAVHRFLARTPSRVLVVQPDDLTGEVEQVNLPGTVDDHPNWRRRYAVAVEDFARHPAVCGTAAMLRGEGRASVHSPIRTNPRAQPLSRPVGEGGARPRREGEGDAD